MGLKKSLVLAVYLLIPLFLSPAFAQTPFYQGKTIRIIVGNSAGEAYDMYARTMALFMPKHIPGKPNIIIQNMPGAGSMIAANYVYRIAKPDGLTIGAIFPALYFDQLIGRKEVQFEWAKYAWIGTPVISEHHMYMRADSPYKTLDDVRNAKEPPKCGASGTSSTGYYMPKLLEEIFGTKFNIVTGYIGGSDIDLAVERGELICRSFTITAYFAREPFFTWRKKGFVRVLFQTSKKRDPRLPDVPTVYEFMDKYKTPESSKRLAAVVLAAGSVGRPIVGPPGMPPDKVKIFREAFTKTMHDPEYKAEAEKRRLELHPISGEELEALAKDVIDQPPDIVQKIKKLLEK